MIKQTYNARYRPRRKENKLPMRIACSRDPARSRGPGLTVAFETAPNQRAGPNVAMDRQHSRAAMTRSTAQT